MPGVPEWRIYLCNRSGMKTKKQTRTIRLTVPRDVYAKLAFLAAREGVTVSQFAHAGVLAHIATGGMVPLDLVPEMLAADGIAETPETTMPGDNSGDADLANDLSIEDLL